MSGAVEPTTNTIIGNDTTTTHLLTNTWWSELQNLRSENVVVIVLVAVFLSKVAGIFWRKIIHDRLLNGKVKKLEREIAILKKMSIPLNTPSMFAQYAKVQRRWKKRDRMLSEIKSSRAHWVKQAVSYVAQYVLTFAMPLACMLVWYGRSLFDLKRREWCCLSSGNGTMCLPEMICHSDSGLAVSIAFFIIITHRSVDYLTSLIQ